jgi:hypothetical protein
VVEDKARRVANFHRNTLVALAEVVAAAGLSHPGELRSEHIQLRRANGEVISAAQAYPALEAGCLLTEPDHPTYGAAWRSARADSFAPAP